MTHVRRWILICAAAAFAAGVSAGLAFPGVAAAFSADRPIDPDEQYVQDMNRRYDLDARQQEWLRIVLRRAKEEMFSVFQGNFDQLPPVVQTEVQAVRRRQVERFRQLLYPEQLKRYDADLAQKGAVK